MAPLQALTIAQPWPRMFLLDDDAKPVENRDWPTPAGLVGQHLALHGGRLPKSKADFVQVREALTWVNDMVWGGEEDPESWLDDQQVLDLCVPGIFAVVKLLPSVTALDSPWFTGPHGWVWSDITLIEPVPCRGAKGLWPVEGEVLAQVREAYRLARAGGAPARSPVPEVPAAPALESPPTLAAAPAVFRPGLPVTAVPRNPQHGQLYGLQVGADWVTFRVNKTFQRFEGASVATSETWSWCSRLTPGAGTGTRSAFQAWCARLEQERAA